MYYLTAMSSDENQVFLLSDLTRETEDRLGWHIAFGTIFAQAASLCLEVNKKDFENYLTMEGDYDNQFLIKRDPVSDSDKRFHADMQRSVEFGAYGISSLIVPYLTGLTVIEVSVKGTGFDFWLGTEGETGNLFQKKARLEVSGILNGNPSQVKARVKTKLKQISPTDKLPYPGFVSIVEFSSFKMVLLQKKVGDINE